MQREFRSVEKMLEEKDAKMEEMKAHLNEVINKKPDEKLLADNSTQTSTDDAFANTHQKPKKAVFIPIDQGIYAPVPITCNCSDQPADTYSVPEIV